MRLSSALYRPDVGLSAGGSRMVDHSKEMGIPWPTLKATDIGDLVSFLNAPAPPK